MKYLLQSLMMLAVIEIYAQTPLTYNKFYSSDTVNMFSNGTNILPYTDTSFVVANTFYSNYYHKNGLELIHFNYNGQVIWRRVNIINLEGFYINGFGELIRTQNGGFAFISFRNPYWTGDMHDAHLMLFDSLGIFEQEKLYTRYPGSVDRAFAGCQTSDGGFLLAGFTFDIVDFTADTTNIYVVRTNAEGDTIWTKMFDYGKDERAGIVKEDYDGGYLIGGFTATFTYTESDGTGDGDGLIYKLNTDGSVRWMLNIGTWDDDCDAYIVPCKTEPGKYYVWSCKGISFFGIDSEARLYYLAKMDSTGYTYWRTEFTGQTKNIQKAIEMPDGKILLVGYDSFGDGYSWCFPDWGWMALLDSTGTVLWDRTFYLYDEETIYGYAWLTDAIPATDGGYIVVGRYDLQLQPLALPMTHVWLLKVDENGCITPGCNENLIFLSTNETQLMPLSNKEALVQIYPNPAQNMVTVTYNLYNQQQNSKAEAQLYLYNASGKLVFQTVLQGAGTETISIAHLPAGIYFCQVIADSGKTLWHQKLLVVK
ncbi:T9SS C-terminal target domain-containing protein [Sphingobacteriales bacterium UPWRP_1]|nr:hypothetical protein BVG80_13010 [Sphingobacteriales bacterium TSM_CSM]PSJ75804.1 T9SS C-terminal target domain-containing protein [Sphingobacteriales bacterium UPWRP_1]